MDKIMIVFPQDSYTQGLQVYAVGGAVRDELLGFRHAADYDWVVVGATPATMLERGFMPVGADFPVFLHPLTKEEYALARTERKTGVGYKGFSFYTDATVSLEDDLRRRDLSINAMAQDQFGTIIDPFGGLQDLRQGVLRHVSEAFLEDPVRILRLSRFAAQFVGFSIHPDTMRLCRDMVLNGEVDALVPERVWAEIIKGLLCPRPSVMFYVLQDCGALCRVLPSLDLDEFMLTALDRCEELADLRDDTLGESENSKESAVAMRYALLSLMSSELSPLSQSLRVSAMCHDYAHTLRRMLSRDAPWLSTNAQTIVTFLKQLDVLRKPERFSDLWVLLVFLAQQAQTLPCTLMPLQPLSPAIMARWLAYAKAIRGVDVRAISQAYAGQGPQIKAAVEQAQSRALQAQFGLD